jgi:ATP-dependent exoDNAse (exonuclease V) beta subunit
VLTEADGSMTEGIVDLAFEHDGGWHVVDYKTDASDDAFATYAAQVSIYVTAIARATGMPACGYLLRV